MATEREGYIIRLSSRVGGPLDQRSANSAQEAALMAISLIREAGSLEDGDTISILTQIVED